MKRLIFTSLLSLFFLGSYAQEKEENSHSQTTTKETPKGSWTVHKEYDEEGNLIASDSTYTYSWSSRNGEEIPAKKLDSILQEMRSHFPSFKNSFSDGFDLEEFRDSFFGDQNFQDFFKQGFEQMEAFKKQFF